MSGIYILETRDDNDKVEYRVALLYSIGALSYDAGGFTRADKYESGSPDVWIKNARILFSSSKVFSDYYSALEYAHELEKKELTTYDVSRIVIRRKF
jgi:hypothetical protein